MRVRSCKGFSIPEVLVGVLIGFSIIVFGSRYLLKSQKILAQEVIGSDALFQSYLLRLDIQKQLKNPIISCDSNNLIIQNLDSLVSLNSFLLNKYSALNKIRFYCFEENEEGGYKNWQTTSEPTWIEYSVTLLENKKPRTWDDGIIRGLPQ